jgi:hypothetical protein
MPMNNKMKNMNNAVTQEQLGSGVTTDDQMGDGAILNLVTKALSHLMPSLLAKFGEKVGDVVGNHAGKLADRQLSKLGMAGSGSGKKLAVAKTNPNKYGVINGPHFVTSSNSGVGNTSTIVARPKSKRGSGVDPAGGAIDPAGSKSGDGIGLAGVQGPMPRKRRTKLQMAEDRAQEGMGHKEGMGHSSKKKRSSEIISMQM